MNSRLTTINTNKRWVTQEFYQSQYNKQIIKMAIIILNEIKLPRLQKMKALSALNRKYTFIGGKKTAKNIK